MSSSKMRPQCFFLRFPRSDECLTHEFSINFQWEPLPSPSWVKKSLGYPKPPALTHQVSHPRRLLCLYDSKDNTVLRISLPKSCEFILKASIMHRTPMSCRLFKLVQITEGPRSLPTPTPLCHGGPHSFALSSVSPPELSLFGLRFSFG